MTIACYPAIRNCGTVLPQVTPNLFCGSIREVSESEQDVLDQTRGPVSKVAAQGLHTTSLGERGEGIKEVE